MSLIAEGSPNPDKDKRISRSYNPEAQSCSSSESEITGPNLSFIWRLWKDNNGLILVGVIGYGQQIQWQVPSEVGTYWIELVVDDDPNPDYDAPGEKKECKKCSQVSNTDDPAARDWLKVWVIYEGKVDLDCDSDNDGKLEEDDEEEAKEDSPPGCFVDLETTKELVVKTKVRGNGGKVRISWYGDGQVTVYDENGNPLQSPLEWTVPSGSSRRTFKVKGEGIGKVWFFSFLLDAQNNVLTTDKVVFTVPWEIVLIEEQTGNFVKMLPKVYVSSPHPTIHLHQCQITAENLPDGGNIVKLGLQGTIRSRACDLVPGNLGTIASFALYTNDDPSEPIIISVASDWDSNGVADMWLQKLSAGSLTRPYPFEAHFNVQVPIGGFDEGTHYLRLEVYDSLTGAIGAAEIEFEVSFNESKSLWEVSSSSFIIVDDWEEFYPLAIRVGTSNAHFPESFSVPLLNKISRKVIRGPDQCWYVANEQGNSIDILFLLTYDCESSLFPLPSPMGVEDEGSGEGLHLYGLLSDPSNPYLNAANFVLGLFVGFAEGGFNLVSGTAQGLWTIAKFAYAHYLEYSPTGWAEKKVLKIIAPNFVRELENVTIKWETLKAASILVRDMLMRTETLQAVANGEWNKIPYTLSYDFREALRLASSLLLAAWEYVRDWVWSQYKGFLEADAYEKGKVIGKLIFEVVMTIIPLTKLGKVAQFVGRLGKIKFFNAFLSRLRSGSPLFVQHPALAKKLESESIIWLRVLQSICFAAGTLVWTKEGLKPIEQIRFGDWVLSKDPNSGKQEYRQVIATVKTYANQLRQLRYRDLSPQKTNLKVQPGRKRERIAHEDNDKDEGDEGNDGSDGEGEEEEIECTEEHLFWSVNRNGFVPAGQLVIGDRLLSASGQEAVLTANRRKEAKLGQPFITYNLEVEGFHTYFVGKKGIWVHNDCEKIKKIREAFKAAGWELPLLPSKKSANVAYGQIWRGGQIAWKELIGVSGTKNLREEAVIRKGLLKGYEVLKYNANDVAELAQTLGETIKIGGESHSEIKILSRVLQLIKEGVAMDEILIVSEGRPCDSCDTVLEAFAKRYPQIKVRVQWFYIKTEMGWQESPGEFIYSP
ncbi:MAG: polymorphic toxin-type HINT domain-containing protein [Archaeoglobaceae archaeon]